jgi:hypothetical protein
MIDQQHLRAKLPGDRGAVQPGRTGADDDGVEVEGDVVQGVYFQAPLTIFTIT